MFFALACLFFSMETRGLEPLTSAVQRRRSPSWAMSPLLCTLPFLLMFSFNIIGWLFIAFLPLSGFLATLYFRWAWLDLNQRPLPYQRNALTSWATGPQLSLYFLGNFSCKIISELFWLLFLVFSQTWTFVFCSLFILLFLLPLTTE